MRHLNAPYLFMHATNMRLYTEFGSKEAGLLRVTGTINLLNIL